MKYSSLFIAFFATIVQFYDYALFGLSAGILSQYFMPPGSGEDKLFHFFTIYSISVIARPLGSLIFGYIGDKYSRIASIKLASFIAMISTLSVAIIPSFSQIGYISAGFLLLSRMLFLISQGGEIDVTRIYVAEKLNNHKNLAAGIISFCTQFGSLLAAISYYVALKFSNNYSWKICFIIGGVGGLIVMLYRHSIQESELFKKNKANRVNLDSESLWDIIKVNKFRFIAAIFAHGAIGGSYNFLIIFLNVFAATNTEILSLEEARLMNIILIICFGIFALISGYLADKIKSSVQVIIAIVLTYITFAFMILANINIAYFNIIFVILATFYIVPMHIILQLLFKTEHKSRLYSLAHSIGALLFSSSTPLISMLIWKNTLSINAILGLYLTLVTVIFIIILTLRRLGLTA